MELHMYDELWEESPRIRQERAKARLRGAQEMFVNIISARFPALTELAKQQAEQANSPNALNKLARKVVIAPDEDAVRRLLSPH